MCSVPHACGYVPLDPPATLRHSCESSLMETLLRTSGEHRCAAESRLTRYGPSLPMRQVKGVAESCSFIAMVHSDWAYWNRQVTDVLMSRKRCEQFVIKPPPPFLGAGRRLATRRTYCLKLFPCPVEAEQRPLSPLHASRLSCGYGLQRFYLLAPSLRLQALFASRVSRAWSCKDASSDLIRTHI